ncbi:hypothetical protein CLOSBL3_20565 [Clostridiaceae bacterium BL-3]|nr:hypothetical protein CLOSBL3_20565 [Clostridiaceae bacterium BL-3]
MASVDLNTSHVKVQQLIWMAKIDIYSYLNTSHVKVQHH